MFTLSSTATKLSVLAISTWIAVGTLDSMALGFHQPSAQSVTVTLPAVTIVGHRADLMQDATRAVAKSDSTPSI
jgi:hypothetical protein